MHEKPGIVGWFFGIHVVPGVKAYKLGQELYQKLRDIGADPDAEGTSVNKGENVPLLTDEQRLLVYSAEKACYDRFGFEGVN